MENAISAIAYTALLVSLSVLGFRFGWWLAGRGINEDDE